MPFRFEPGWTWANEAAVAALALAVGLGVHAAVGALVVDPPPSAPASAVHLPLPDLPLRSPSLDEDAVLAAAERDPFAPDIMPFDEQPDAWGGTDGSGDVAPAAVRLTGIVLLPDGGAAALSVNGGPAQLVRVGGRLDGWRLLRVESGAATVEGPDGTLHLRLPEAPAPALARAGTP